MILILSGLPASGKSTYARKWVEEDPEHRYRINYDELRLELYGPDWKFNRKDEEAMKQEARLRVESALWAHKDVVVDNTNLTPRARAVWETVAKDFGIPFQQHDIDTPVSVCVTRDKARQGNARVGRQVIERMALTTGWIDWEEKPPYFRDFIIVDIDGTIADLFHRLAYVKTDGQKKDWDSFFANVDKDEPIAPIIRLVTRLYQWYDILIVSGRSPDNGCGKATEDWLDKHMGGYVTHLFMRPSGDHRDDYVVKQEILDLLPKHRIAYVFDDRNQVVDMWRKNGLTCLQVRDGRF